MADLFAQKPLLTVADAVARLCGMFPRHADEIEAWTSVYGRTLGHLQPSALDAAVNQVLDRWSKSVPPKPADFAQRAPERAADRKDGQQWWYGAAARSDALHARKRALVTDAMRWYEADIRERGQYYGHSADVFADCTRFELDRLADAALFGTAQLAPTGDPQTLAMTEELWQSAHDRTRTRLEPKARGDALVPVGVIRDVTVKHRPAALELMEQGYDARDNAAEAVL